MRISSTLPAAAFLVVLASASSARAQTLPSDAHGALVSSSASLGGPFNGTDINAFVGANAFYSRGYTGTRAIVSNIEGGTAWNGHETLAHATTKIFAPGYAGTRLGEADRHATWSGQTIAGRATATGVAFGYAGAQRGIAYGSTLWSGAVSQGYNGAPWSNSYQIGSWYSLYYPYVTSMVTGLNRQTADVLNSSWGYTVNGGDAFTVGIDALVAQSHKTMVASAMNEGYGLNKVGGIAGSNNAISVAALGPDTDGYAHAAGFSSGGYNDFWDGVSTVPAARVRVDIAAPGQNMTLAYYGGVTGGNYGGVATGGPNYYAFDAAGTSFAAPAVAGGAALLVDAGKDLYGTAEAIDGRIVKAVLLNSATKTADWDNAQSVGLDGVLRTTQALDAHVGAGILNLGRAWTQYTAGTHDLAGLGGGAVDAVGWDFGGVDEGSQTDYLLGSLAGGSTLTATLNWFVESSIVSLSEQNGYYYQMRSFTDLDLQVLDSSGGLVAESSADYINTEHLSFLLPRSDSYVLRVLWNGERYDYLGDGRGAQYGLAWSGVRAVPEPTSLAALAIGVAGLARRRRR